MIKGQSILGDIFVAFFFLIIIIGLVWMFFEHIPQQVSNIKEQKACAEAETMSKFLFEVNETNMTIEPFVINYSKFYNKNYTEILNETGAKASFKIKYSIYAFNNDVTDDTSINPTVTPPDVYILRDGDDIIVKAGTIGLSASFYMKLLFPHIAFDEITIVGVGDYYIVNNYSSPTSTSNISEINVNGTISGGGFPLATINISLKEIPKLVYVRDATCTGICPIYIGDNRSNITGEIGPGSLYREKDYCIIKRRCIIIRNNDTYSADLEIIAW
ncbi:MAG: hypothetical protein JSW73_04670 [Candidatus Woesearchaeota archaeon]|nr:MAG: hypothetical protein JSW73_04670 [Candidatus Woesearchaeota archaeon]